ncbi:hypothetical protein CKY07_11135 [Enterococcus faecium]|nr:hypothetical protein CKY07_11135 [Enterococcus faecium]
MFLWLKTLYRKRAVTWPFIFYTIIWTLSTFFFSTLNIYLHKIFYAINNKLVFVCSYSLLTFLSNMLF